VRGSASRADSANALAPQRVGNEDKPVFYHADCHATFLGVTMAVVRPFDGEDVREHLARHLEADAVVAPVDSVRTPAFGAVATTTVGLYAHARALRGSVSSRNCISRPLGQPPTGKAHSVGKCRVEQFLINGTVAATATSEHFELQCHVGVVRGHGRCRLLQQVHTRFNDTVAHIVRETRIVSQAHIFKECVRQFAKRVRDWRARVGGSLGQWNHAPGRGSDWAGCVTIRLLRGESGHSARRVGLAKGG
jgi:hypothetical protein